MIDKLVNALVDTFGLTYDQIEDALWLAPHLPKPHSAVEVPQETSTAEAETGSDTPPPNHANTARSDSSVAEKPPATATEPPEAAPGGLFVPRPGLSKAGTMSATPVRVPTTEALPGKRGINASLRPLKRRFPSARTRILDVTATVEQIANGGPAVAVLKAAPERWLEVALIIDESASMRVWPEMVREFAILLQRHGSFRDVRSWYVNLDQETLRLYGEPGLPNSPRRLRHPRELIDSSARRLILVISDCVASGWYDGAMLDAIHEWGRRGPLALVQVLPERLWEVTALGKLTVPLRASSAGARNLSLHAPRLRSEPEIEADDPAVLSRPTVRMPLPVINLAGWSMAPWAKLVANVGDATAEGVVIISQDRVGGAGSEKDKKFTPREPPELTARERVSQFRRAASPAARQLAGYLAAAPLCLPVMRLVHRAMMPAVRQVDLAEVLLSGLLRQVTSEAEAGRAEDVFYEFFPGVRELLQSAVKEADQLRVLRSVSRLIEAQTGSTLDFAALLAGDAWSEGPQSRYPIGQKFAEVATGVVRRLARPEERKSVAEGAGVEVGEAVEEPTAAPTPQATSDPRGAIGRVMFSDNATGMTYLVAPGLAVTVTLHGLHAVGRQVKLDFGGRAYQGKVVALDTGHGVAILDLGIPVQEASPLRLAIAPKEEAAKFAEAWGSPDRYPLTPDANNKAVPPWSRVRASAYRLFFDTPVSIPAWMTGAPVMAADRVLGHVVTPNLSGNDSRPIIVATSAVAVREVLLKFSFLPEMRDRDRNALWHPSSDAHTRGALTPCRFTVFESLKMGRRFERWGDLRVSVENAPSNEDVYLLPSRWAPERFHDSRDLAPESTLLEEKKVLGLEFIRDAGRGESLQGFWFYKRMSSGVRHLHLYAPAYDDFLAFGFRRDAGFSGLDVTARRYEAIRREEPSGPERSKKMNDLLRDASGEARGAGVNAAVIRAMYSRGSEGLRLVALASCLGLRGEVPLEILSDVLKSPRSPFEQWAALMALQSAAKTLDMLVVEPCIADLVAVLDDKDNLINLPTDGTRRDLAQRIFELFAAAVGVGLGQWTLDSLRLWLNAKEVHVAPPRPCVVVFGSDQEGKSIELCKALGERFAQAGWRLRASDGFNVGPTVIESFFAIDSASVTAFAATASTSRSRPTQNSVQTETAPAWPELRTKMIADVDCAITICGGRGTRVECEMAMQAGVPLLAIASTGGTAEKFKVSRQRLLQTIGVPAELVGLIDVADSASHQAERIVRVANIVRRMREKRRAEQSIADAPSSSDAKSSQTPWKSLGQLQGHSDVILRLTWHPSGNFLATASVDRTVRIWDIASGQEMMRLAGFTQGINQVVFSPDPETERLATCSFDRTVRVWSTRDWRIIRTIEGHTDDVRDVAWSPDGRFLASASVDRTIALWDAETGELKATASRKRNASAALRVLWMVGGKTLATCWQDGKVCLYDAGALDSGARRELAGPPGELVDLARSPDERLLAACSASGNIRVWTWPDLKVVRDISLGRWTVRSVSFSGDGMFLAANTLGSKGEVRVWSTSSWQECSRFSEATSEYWPCNVAWAPSGYRMATLGERDLVVRVWEAGGLGEVASGVRAT
jgi:WD40 repeat protein